MLVKMQDGSTYNVGKLLAKGDSNTKLRKSDKSGKGYLTAGLSLSPANESGYEVCASRSPGCTQACLFTAGYGVYESVKLARIAKTRYFFQEREAFLAQLKAELVKHAKRAQKKGLRLAVRLNVVSDIPWEAICPSLFSDFPDIQFYDYTKHAKRMVSKLPVNYHLTFSRSEINDSVCKEVCEQSPQANIAVVFSSKVLPTTWNGISVVNGDETDLRFLDPPGSIIGLYAKGRGRKDTSGFVVSIPTIGLINRS